MTHTDGRQVHQALERRVDVAIIGSGPAGSAVASELCRAGASVLVVEAGPWLAPEDFAVSAFDSMADGYRQMGASMTLGLAPIPVVQGRMVGGSSPINGAICWRMPRDVYDEWVDADPALAEALPWARLESLTDVVEERLGVAPTEAAVAGRKNELMAIGAEALGLEHRPIRRNVRGCRGSGRCMQGCPHGAKQSADRTFLTDALEAGAELLSSTEVQRIEVRGGRATGLTARAKGGGLVRVVAKQVVLAASAVQSPSLLLASGIRQGPVGRHFQCHPGVSMAGHFPEPVRMWEGATQGHEVIGLRKEGLKFEALGFGLALLAARLGSSGTALSQDIARMDHSLDWGVAVRAKAEGRVRRLFGRAVVRYQPGADDVRGFRRGLRVMGEMMFAAGATAVAPGVKGFSARIEDPSELARLEREGPRSAGAYTAAITHMFGTCRMGSDPARSVVRPDFRHHAVEGLTVADSSVFPTSLGVNPQVPIMAMALLAGQRLAAGG